MSNDFFEISSHGTVQESALWRLLEEESLYPQALLQRKPFVISEDEGVRDVPPNDNRNFCLFNLGSNDHHQCITSDNFLEVPRNHFAITDNGALLVCPEHQSPDRYLNVGSYYYYYPLVPGITRHAVIVLEKQLQGFISIGLNTHGDKPSGCFYDCKGIVDEMGRDLKEFLPFFSPIGVQIDVVFDSFYTIAKSTPERCNEFLEGWLREKFFRDTEASP